MPDFARACREHGIVFIGPTPEQMEMFGLKHSAREIAERAGVPMLPGTPLITELEEALTQAAAYWLSCYSEKHSGRRRYRDACLCGRSGIASGL